MSEPMFPAPDEGALIPAGAATQPSTNGGNRRMLMAVGGAAAALVLGGGAFLLLTSGGSDPAPVAAGTQPAPSASAPVASPSPPTTAKPVTRPAIATVTTRDPFKPLFVVAVATTTGTTTGATTPAQTAPVIPAVPKATITLAVSKINPTAQTAVIAVDGKAYPVGIGAPFAKNFVLYSVFNAQCVGVLFGDQSVPVCTTNPQTVSP